jgi:hypothetical protein
MVQKPDLDRHRAAFQKRTQMVANELDFVLLWPDASGNSAILIGIHFWGG